MTGIANAHVARAPVLVLSGVPPQAQENRGALQDMVHTDLVRSITRYARTVREPSRILPELDEAVARALGESGEPGPAYVDFPTDTLRAERAARAACWTNTCARSRRRRCLPIPPTALRAAELVLVGAAPAGDQRPRRAARRCRARALPRPDRGRVPRHGREPRPRRRRAPGRRRGHARAGDGRGRPRGHGRAPARFPARLRLAGRVRRGALPAHRRPSPAKCATTGAARSRWWPTQASRSTRFSPRRAARTPAVDRAWVAGLRARHAERVDRRQRGDACRARRQRRSHASGSPARRPAGRAAAREHRRGRRRRQPELRPRRPVVVGLARPGLARLHRRRHAVRHRREPRVPAARRGGGRPATARSASTRWRSTPRRATGRRC